MPYDLIQCPKCYHRHFRARSICPYCQRGDLPALITKDGLVSRLKEGCDWLYDGELCQEAADAIEKMDGQKLNEWRPQYAVTCDGDVVNYAAGSATWNGWNGGVPAGTQIAFHRAMDRLTAEAEEKRANEIRKHGEIARFVIIFLAVLAISAVLISTVDKIVHKKPTASASATELETEVHTAELSLPQPPPEPPQ